jgi:hypothetical protein
VATIKVASFEQIKGTAVLTGSADHPVVVLHLVNRKGETYTREYALRQKTITHAVQYTVRLLASDLVQGLRPKSKKAPITMLLEWWKRPYVLTVEAQHRPMVEGAFVEVRQQMLERIAERIARAQAQAAEVEAAL